MSKKKKPAPEEQPDFIRRERQRLRQRQHLFATDGPCSPYELRALRDAKTVWLRAYCAAIESFVPNEAADIADAAVKAFTKRFYSCS